MIRTHNVKDSIKIVKGKVILRPEPIEEIEVSGCETLKFINNEVFHIKDNISRLEKELEIEKRKLNDKITLQNELKYLGFCDISAPIYKRIDGVIIIDKDGNKVVDRYIHNENCKDKE